MCYYHDVVNDLRTSLKAWTWAVCPQAPLPVFLWHSIHTADWLQPARIAGPGWCGCRGCWYRHSHLYTSHCYNACIRICSSSLKPCLSFYIHSTSAVPLVLVDELFFKIRVWPVWKSLSHGPVALPFGPLPLLTADVTTYCCIESLKLSLFFRTEMYLSHIYF